MKIYVSEENVHDLVIVNVEDEFYLVDLSDVSPSNDTELFACVENELKEGRFVKVDRYEAFDAVKQYGNEMNNDSPVITEQEYEFEIVFLHQPNKKVLFSGQSLVDALFKAKDMYPHAIGVTPTNPHNIKYDEPSKSEKHRVA